jgi:hypothetical protein
MARVLTGRLGTAIIAAAIAAFTVPAVAPAQFSDSYNFLKAVRDRDGGKLEDALRKGGPNMLDTRDTTSGESAVQIVTRRRDTQWLQYLLAKGANPDTRDNSGNTALIYAAQASFSDGVRLLIAARANVNLPNRSGETALIKATQAGDLQSVRLLLQAGADPKKTDTIAGMSARDYAVRDNRLSVILKEIDSAKPVAPQRPVAGPK